MPKETPEGVRTARRSGVFELLLGRVGSKGESVVFKSFASCDATSAGPIVSACLARLREAAHSRHSCSRCPQARTVSKRQTERIPTTSPLEDASQSGTTLNAKEMMGSAKSGAKRESKARTSSERGAGPSCSSAGTGTAGGETRCPKSASDSIVTRPHPSRVKQIKACLGCWVAVAVSAPDPGYSDGCLS